MVIKPACKKEFILLPNSLLNDTQLSIETRGMLAHLLSKPKSWNIRPILLAKALSRRGDRPLGRKRLDRMIREASEAHYMARSTKQTHHDDGSWGPYDYIVGMPDDVAAAVQKSSGAYTFSPPLHREAHTLEVHTPMGNTNHKAQNQKSHKDINPPLLKFSPSGADPTEGNQDELSDYGDAARAAECVFVWEDSKPFNEWMRYRRAKGEALRPPIVERTIAGKRWRGAWLEALYPPDYTDTTGGGAGNADEPSISIGNSDALITLIMATRECSRDEAVKIFASLPDAAPGGD